MGAIGGGLYHAGKHVIWGPKNFKTRGAIEVRMRFRHSSKLYSTGSRKYRLTAAVLQQAARPWEYKCLCPCILRSPRCRRWLLSCAPA